MSVEVKSSGSAQNEFRYADIFPHAVRMLSRGHAGVPNRPPRIYPTNFDSIYAARDRLASFEVSLRRSPQDQEDYERYLRVLGNPNQQILDRFFGGIAPNAGDNRFAITEEEFPAELPQDARHMLMWYLDEGKTTLG